MQQHHQSGPWSMKFEGSAKMVSRMLYMCVLYYICTILSYEHAGPFFFFTSPTVAAVAAADTRARLGRYRVKIHKTAELRTARRPILSLRSTSHPPHPFVIVIFFRIYETRTKKNNKIIIFKIRNTA